MKWTTNKIMKLSNGFFGSHYETGKAVNANAEMLCECVNHIKCLEEKVEILQEFNEKMANLIEQLKEQKK